MTFANLFDHLWQLVQALFGKSRDKDNRRIRKVLELIANVILPLLHGMVVFFNGIPFVDNNDHAFPSFMSKASDPLVILPNPFFGINDHQNHIRTVDGTHGTHDRIFLSVFIDFTRFAHTSCIDHGKFLAICIGKMGIDGIPCGSSYWARNHAVFSKDGIDQA